jgi:hypothetical protein
LAITSKKIFFDQSALIKKTKDLRSLRTGWKARNWRPEFRP